MVDEYIRASNLDEVLGLLKQRGDRARIIGGGVTIHDLAFRGLLGDVTTLIDITPLGLSYVKDNSQFLLIGASTSYSELLNSDRLKKRPAFGALVDALQAIRPLQVRNVATIGGAMCTGIPLLDLPPTAIAMDAKLQLVESGGRRTVAVKDFFLGYLQTALKSSELLIELQIPLPTANTGSAFQKLEINAVDWATLSVVTMLTLNDGKIASAKIAMGGGVGEVPVRALEAEAILLNGTPTEDVIRRTAEEAANRTKFTDDERASSDYRRDIATVFVSESLNKSVTRAKQDRM
ncbi:MAG: FAD binding domain-containing protein [Candidatus Bathyarchaeia archaeon]